MKKRSNNRYLFLLDILLILFVFYELAIIYKIIKNTTKARHEIVSNYIC